MNYVCVCAGVYQIMRPPLFLCHYLSLICLLRLCLCLCLCLCPCVKFCPTHVQVRLVHSRSCMMYPHRPLLSINTITPHTYMALHIIILVPISPIHPFHMPPIHMPIFILMLMLTPMPILNMLVRLLLVGIQWV